MPKFQNQTIVVPFDFSAPSQNALHQILNWADDSNKIHLVHVIIPTPTIVDINPPVWLPPDLDTDARDAMLDRMKEEYSTGPYSNLIHHCLIGDPGSEIVRIAEEEKADMIIMPSHGRSGISRFFLGSVAERVLRLAQCPVTVLRGSKFESDQAKVEAISETA